MKALVIAVALAGARVATAAPLHVDAAAVVPVVVDDGHYFVPLQDWVTDGLPSDDELRKLAGEAYATTSVKLTSVPALLAGVKGFEVKGFDRGGRPCGGALGEVWDWQLASDEPLHVLAELMPLGRCKPFVVTGQRAITVLGGKRATGALARTLKAAFETTDGYATRADRKRAGTATYTVYRDGAHRWAVARAYREREAEGGCGMEIASASAVFTLDAKGAITQTEPTDLGDEDVAFFDADGDGTLEAIAGAYRRDLGMTMAVQLGAYYAFGATSTTAITRAVASARYAGCD